MAIIVQKYGGTSVGSLSRIEMVADNIIATVRKGHQVVVVLSAMAGETNRLVSLAHQLDTQPATRELDMLMAAGEQISISLLAIALVQRGFSAISLLAHQVGIKTDNHFGRARIEMIETERLHQALEQEQVVVVAGFQGQDRDNNITTLGRGGSDTSAVALAVALGANECQIFTDVDGVYSSDPRIVPHAQRLSVVSFEEMLVMASLGAKVLQNRAVEYAYQHNMPIRVLSSFSPSMGTQVLSQQAIIEHYDTAEASTDTAVTSLAHYQDTALVSLTGVVDHGGIAAIFAQTGEQNIEVEMINSFVEPSGSLALSFVVDKADVKKLETTLNGLLSCNTFKGVQIDTKVVKISAIGVGIKSHADVVGKFLTTLVKEQINVKLISTSEIHISAVIDESLLIPAMNKLHSVFGLDLSL